MNTIGKRLLCLRKDVMAMSQRDFAEIMGTSQGALSEMEQDKRGIPMEMFVKISEYSKKDSQFSCDWLLTGQRRSPNSLEKDEGELLENYKKLDSRGQHRLHTVMYEEVDRVTAAGGTVAEAAAAPPQKSKLPPNYPENYPVDEYGDPLVPWAASGWADITPENAEKLQQKLQEFERKSRAQMELEAAKNAAVLKGMPKKE